MPLSLRGITHAYRPGEPVLRGVDLDLSDGETVAVVGPSGSGKTTLLSILGLVQTPSGGAVAIDGVTVPARARKVTRLRRELFAWVFQTVNTLGRRTAVDNVALGLVAGGVSRREAERAARGALGRVGMEAHEDTVVHRLSGGELQRVCIARALVGRPRFVCADEPTGQLDQDTSAEVLDALWALRGPDTTLVVATHDPDVAARCDRIVRVVAGRIEEDGG